jgi:hypothetical protein
MSRNAGIAECERVDLQEDQKGWFVSMSDNKFATAERTTKQIENLTRRAVEVLSNRFNGQIRSAVHFYDKMVFGQMKQTHLQTPDLTGLIRN